MDETAPRLARCFRGHSTPAGKTFCESCGASLDAPTTPTPAPIEATRSRRTLLRRRS